MTTPPAGSQPLSLRQVERADLLDVFRIEKQCFSQPWPYAAFEQFLGESGFMLAERDDVVVGYVVADVIPNYGRDIGHIKDLAVRPESRGQGVGRSLLERALTTLFVDSTALVKLEVRESNDPALDLYRDVGFEPMRRVPRYYDDGEAALVMVLDLDGWATGDPASPDIDDE
ncbi:ribosomal-protein-alanine N-acetyltransferase [Halogranum rubrum]|uniref:Ribosomal-protein-alanine N-acetyltransferase n=2 Tax=Halogranum rubrum TaxID=553466 RepID=A0A1I4AS28_9EURY|nr:MULTISPECIES: ribosomal protein S18-alanine N-acetyltransferase [Halogranum]SFK59332.1 ribosomal-protein-alanine N-acetyltransferase [Halogranum rubrum]